MIGRARKILIFSAFLFVLALICFAQLEITTSIIFGNQNYVPGTTSFQLCDACTTPHSMWKIASNTSVKTLQNHNSKQQAMIKKTSDLASASTQCKDHDHRLIQLAFLEIEKSKQKHYLSLRNMTKAINMSMLHAVTRAPHHSQCQCSQ